MNRKDEEMAIKRIGNSLSNWLLLKRPFFYRFRNKLAHGKIKDGIFFAAGLLAFLAAYLALLNLIFWAHLPTGLLS